jgi:hypothetical protein
MHQPSLAHVVCHSSSPASDRRWSLLMAACLAGLQGAASPARRRSYPTPALGGSVYGWQGRFKCEGVAGWCATGPEARPGAIAAGAGRSCREADGRRTGETTHWTGLALAISLHSCSGSGRRTRAAAPGAAVQAVVRSALCHEFQQLSQNFGQVNGPGNYGKSATAQFFLLKMRRKLSSKGDFASAPRCV